MNKKEKNQILINSYFESMPCELGVNPDGFNLTTHSHKDPDVSKQSQSELSIRSYLISIIYK